MHISRIAQSLNANHCLGQAPIRGQPTVGTKEITLDSTINRLPQTRDGLTFEEVVYARRSIRAFLPQPVPDEIIRDEVLTRVFRTPVTVVDGPTGRFAVYHRTAPVE